MTVSAAFEKSAAANRAALIGYLPAGYPSVDGAIEAMRAMVDAGVDAIEIGLPYTDPLMDGPVIQNAVAAALDQGTTTADVLRTAEAVARTGVPALVMTAWNPIARYGATAFARDLAAAGGSGVITPDVTPDAAGDVPDDDWISAARAHDLDTVFLVAPSSTDDRLKLTADACRGFIYATSTMGVTGARDRLDDAASALVARTRAVTELPIAVGIGVSNSDQAAAVAGFAEGVIVGTAFVRELVDGPDLSSGVSGVAALARELAEGVRRG